VPGVPVTAEIPSAPGLVCTVRPVPSAGSFAIRGVPVSTVPPDRAPVVCAPLAAPSELAGVRGLEAGVCGDPVIT